MKKHSGGFTLVEVLVAMVVSGIILGGIVMLFGTSVLHKSAGERQQQVFEGGRQMLNELKTTLRYAKPSTINPQAPTADTESLTYDCEVYQEHTDLDKKMQSYTMEIKWRDAAKKQLVIRKINNTEQREEYTRYFPSDDHLAMSAFEGNFPIVLVDEKAGIYEIDLPLQYKMDQTGMKLEHFVTSVRPLEAEVENKNDWLEMRERYMKIADIVKRGSQNGTLTAAEQEIYAAYKAGYISWGGFNNDGVRNYVRDTYYSGTWPEARVTYPLKNGTLNTETRYVQPNLQNAANIEDTFLFLGLSGTAKNNWNTNFIYNHEVKKWSFIKEYSQYNNSIANNSYNQRFWVSGANPLGKEITDNLSGLWIYEGTDGYVVTK